MFVYMLKDIDRKMVAVFCVIFVLCLQQSELSALNQEEQHSGGFLLESFGRWESLHVVSRAKS